MLNTLMENDSIFLYGILASACLGPILYSVAGKSWATSAMKESLHNDKEEPRKNESATTLRMMLRCGALSSLVDTQKAEVSRLSLELIAAKDEIADLKTSLQVSRDENQNLQALGVVMEHQLKHFQEKSMRLSIVSGLSTRQSRLQADELQSLRSKLEVGLHERAELRTELDDALRMKERLNKRLSDTKELLLEREQTVSKLNEANFEYEAKIKAQRFALQGLVEEKERLRALAYRSSRDFAIDSISESNTAVSKDSFKPKSAIRRLGSFSFGSRRSARDKEPASFIGPGRYRSATS